MLASNILALFAAVAVATPIADGSTSASGKLDRRETYLVEGNATSAELWSEPGDSLLEARQVNYRCFSGGLAHGNDMFHTLNKACDRLQGGYATRQEKKTCQNDGLARVNYAILNTVGGRGHDRAACIDRLGDILRACKYGGRVNRANWEMLADPNFGRC